MSNNSNTSQNITGIATNIKRGRPNGQTNKDGHNAGRKRKQMDNQSFMTSFFAKSSDDVVQSEASASNNLISLGRNEQVWSMQLLCLQNYCSHVGF